MENPFVNSVLLDQFTTPAFAVANGMIRQVNLAAQKCMLCADAPVAPLLGDHAEIYHNFQSGCLCIPLQICGSSMDFCITKIVGGELFVAHSALSEDLRGMALAASTLRASLSNISALTDVLRSEKNPLAAELNREVFRMCRLVCNMSDAATSTESNQQITDISAILAEVFEKATALMEEIGITVHYQGIRKPVRTYADPTMLQRAILNLISNSAKFTPPGGHIHAVLSQHGNYLHLTLWDTGEGIDPQLLPTIFSRYRRESAIEDSRHGIGLGMRMVYNAARAHGGTVLIDSFNGSSRVTLTLAIRSKPAGMLVSPQFIPDYAGGRDHALQELSDVLPAKLFE